LARGEDRSGCALITGRAGIAMTSASTILDFDPQRDVDPEAAAKTRLLLGRVLCSQGTSGLARALHVAAPAVAQLKHRVACVTCRSRLDTLTTSLAAASGGHTGTDLKDWKGLAPPEYPAPLTAWLAADAGRGLEPAPRALSDPTALAAFLAAFGSGGVEAAEVVGSSSSGGRRSGRSGGVDRCPQHAPRTATSAKSSVGVASTSTATGACASSALSVMSTSDRERYIALLHGSTSDAEWRQLGSVDVDSVMCDLFSWLGNRGLCSSCVDAVTGALLEVRRAVTGNCTCSRCMGLCGGRTPQAAAAVHDSSEALAKASALALPGAPPELLRVQGQLRAICGVYRLDAVCFNGRPVYKKESSEAYLLYTSLKDWMVSGRADAGGSRCEGWAYVTDPAKTPDSVCGVWKVSGPRGWEEDPSLCVTVFEGLPEDMRLGLGYDDGSLIARRLAADDRGVLVVPLQEPEVLEEVLWAPDETPLSSTRSGVCAHVTTAEMAQRELRCWLRWLLRERLDAQRRRVLAQAQVASSLCRLFACAALRQLEQAAEEPPATPARREKKGRAKKGRAGDTNSLEDIAATCTIEVDSSASPSLVDGGCVKGQSGASRASPASASTTASSGKSCPNMDGDESASTRASSEEPPDAHRAELAMGARRLMEQMGWRPEAINNAEILGTTEVAAWLEQHPCYLQAIHEERQKLKIKFLEWAQATVR